MGSPDFKSVQICTAKDLCMFCCFKLRWISDFHDRQKQSPRSALQKKRVL